MRTTNTLSLTGEHMKIEANLVKIDNRKYWIDGSEIADTGLMQIDDGYYYSLIYKSEWSVGKGINYRICTSFIELREDIATRREEIISTYGTPEQVKNLIDNNDIDNITHWA